MHTFKILATATVAALAQSAMAQCSNYANVPGGTLVAQADDAVRTVGLPFAFPFNGTNYTQITISTNGWVKLGGTTNTSAELGDSEGLMLNTPFSATNTNPRLAVCWDDLNAGTPAGVFYASDASQASVVWRNVIHFGQAASLANCECILTPAGDIYFNYDATCTYNLSTSTSIVGISKSDNTVVAGTHTVNWTTASPGPIAVTDATAYELFTAAGGLNPFDLNGTGVTLHFAPTGASSYDVTTSTLTTCIPAGSYPTLATASTSVGTGCPAAVPNGSIYELYTVSTGTNPIDLANTSLLFTRSGDNYTLSQGPGFDATYNVTGTIESAGGDDVVITYPLAGSFSFGSIAYTQVSLSSNGYIWFGASTTQQFNASAATFNSSPARVAGHWKDLVPNNTTAPIYIENTATRFRATWENVPYFSGAGTKTFQIELDLATGNVIVSHSALVGTYTTSPPLVGISGGAAANLGNDNLVTAGVANVVGPRQITGGVAPMAHTTSLAAIGQNFVMTTTVPAGNVGFGAWLVGGSNPNAPLDNFFGPGSTIGCSLYSDFTIDFDIFFAFTPGSTSYSKTIPVPYDTNLSGLVIFTQAAAYTPNPVTFAWTSNGRTQAVGL